MAEKNVVWKDRKRWLFGLPWSFTRYRLYEDKLVIDTGFFTRHEDEVRLYRILDISLSRTFGERLFGLGTIHCCSGDKTSPEFDIKRIKKSGELKDLLSDMIENEREKRRVGAREFMDSDVDGFNDSDDSEFH